MKIWFMGNVVDGCNFIEISDIFVKSFVFLGKGHLIYCTFANLVFVCTTQS